MEFRRPFDIIGNHSEKNILSLQQSRQRRPIVPTGEPLRVNTHYYTIFSRARPSDIPYAHMRRQISVIKGCKVDLQPGSEYRGSRSGSTNRADRFPPPPPPTYRASCINLLETNENRSGAVAPAQYNARPAVAYPISRRRIAVDSIERHRVVYDLHGDGNTGNKIATMEQSNAAERRRNYDHCNECNNGTLETKVANSQLTQTVNLVLSNMTRGMTVPM